MKMLGKLLINPEKVMKNGELISLRGGYSGETCAAISGTGSILCNVSKSEALFGAGCDSSGSNCNGNWCCDSCGSASWNNC